MYGEPTSTIVTVPDPSPTDVLALRITVPGLSPSQGAIEDRPLAPGLSPGPTDAIVLVQGPNLSPTLPTVPTPIPSPCKSTSQAGPCLKGPSPLPSP